MRILLVRHAEPDYFIDSLTPKGWREAELLGRRMVRYDIRDFYVSPLGRARDTADCTLSKLGRTAEVLPWLKEFHGSYPDPATGKPRLAWDLPPRVWTSYPGIADPDTWLNCPLFDDGDFRSVWQETKDGVAALLARYGFRQDGPVWLADRNTPDTIALFCHFGISMAVLACLMNLSPMVLWHHVLCLPSSVSEVVTEERIPGEVSFRITRLGDITHLEAAGESRSTAGLFPECFTGVDSTDPATNLSDLHRNP